MEHLTLTRLYDPRLGYSTDRELILMLKERVNELQNKVDELISHINGETVEEKGYND